MYFVVFLCFLSKIINFNKQLFNIICILCFQKIYIMKKITLLFILTILFIFNSFGQVAGYSFIQSSGTYNEITGGTVLGTATNDDNSFNAINIGFNFVFNNVIQTQISVNANGFLVMGASATSSYLSLSSGTSNNVVAALNGDLQSNPTGELSYILSGTAPNQVLTVQWKSYRNYAFSATDPDDYNFQIKLYETSNDIEVVYGSFVQNANDRTRQVGLRGSSNTDFKNRTTTIDWSATTAGSINSDNCSLTASILPTSGLTFKWTTPSCFSPASIIASAITTATATVSWSAVVPTPATGYQYVISTDANAPAGAGTPTTAVSVPVTMLMANTLYYIYVRSNCGGSFSAWSSASFTTACTAITSFSENFDGVTIPALPNCWGGVFDGAAPGAQVITGISFASSPNALRMRSDGSALTASIIAVSPNISNLSAGTHRLVFKALTNDNADDLIIGTLSNPNDATTFTPLQNVDINTVSAQYIVSFLGYTGTNQYIGFKRLCVNTYNSVFVDDISWEPIPAVAPFCATGITATPDAACGNFNTAINWTATPNTEGYKLTIGTTAGGSNILNNVNIGNVLTYSLPGTFATTYYYKITPFNVVGSAVGCVEQSFATFATGCYCTSVPSSNDGEGITNVLIGSTDFPNTDVTYFDHTAIPVSLQQAVNANVQVTFNTTGGFGSYDYNTVVWIDFNNNFNFEASEIVFTGPSALESPTTLNASFIMPLTAGLGNHRMRIVATDALQSIPNPCYNSSYGVTLDFNINITAAPACVAPIGLTSSAVTPTTATISWTALSTAPSVGYEYVVSPTNVLPTVAGTPTTAITANITSGLSPITTYYAFVRSNCGGSFSAWSASINFTTLCSPLAAPATENFDTFLPSCWSKGQSGNLTTGPTAFVNNTSGWNADGFANVTAIGAIDVNVWNAALNDWIISPQFTIPATGYKLQFDAAATQYLSTFGPQNPVAPTTPWEADDKIEVLVSTTGTSNWTILNTFNDTNQPSATGTNYIYNLDAYSGQNVRIAFRAVEGASNGSADIEFSIDNLNVTNLLKTESFDLTGFSAYPNPVKDVLNLTYTKDISNVSVLNLLGQEVITKSVNASQSKIDMSNLTNGTYLVKVTVDGFVKTLKVVKQ